MIDAEALIFIAAHQQVLWSTPPRRRTPAGNQAYLAVCAIYRDEAPYLREWIEFHRLVGVERFFLYDNRSTRRPPGGRSRRTSRAGRRAARLAAVSRGSCTAYDHCLRDARRRGALDRLHRPRRVPVLADGRPVPEVLSEYERWPGVGVNWAMFGPQAPHQPAGPRDRELPAAADHGRRTAQIKSIVDPARAERCASAHHFEYRHGLAVDENGYPIGPTAITTPSPSSGCGSTTTTRSRRANSKATRWRAPRHRQAEPDHR